eukprot:6757781-Ditylum_brightwellii.AAC.1
MDISTTDSTCTIIALKITAAAVTTTPLTNVAVSSIATTTATDVTTTLQLVGQLLLLQLQQTQPLL